MNGSRLRQGVSVAGGYALLFLLVYGRSFVDGTYLVESDLYEQYLPMFLAPATTWSSFEFGGFPAFADAQDVINAYLPHLLFKGVLNSWTALAISAHVLAACFTYAYVFNITASRPASAFAGCAYALSEAMIERIAHLTILHAIVWLPLIALSIDRIRSTRQGRWIVLGSVALAQCLLSGHPQIALYTYYVCALYALVGGRAERAGRAYYVALAVMFVLGGLLSAVKAVPILEASLLTVRQETSFSQFIGHANSPAQMLSVLFPTILHEGREAPTYVGLATSALAIIGALQARREWRAAFWLVMAVGGFLLGSGDNTPLASVAYYTPGYDKFRVGARHLFLAAFGAAVLAGFALAAVEKRRVRIRTVTSCVAALIAMVAGGAAVIAWSPEAFRFEDRESLPWRLPVWNSGIWEQFAIAAVTLSVLLWMSRARRPRVAMAVLIVVLVGDGLHAIPYQLTPKGIAAVEAPALAIEQPSVHAVQLAAEMKSLDQRVLPLNGSSLDAIAPGTFARVWRIPSAGGYNPMLLADYAALATMQANGAVRSFTLSPDDAALDLLAVKYVLVSQHDIPQPSTFEGEGVKWDSRPLDLSIGRPDCGHPYQRSTSVPLPEDIEISALALITFLRCSEHVPTGAEVATVRLGGSDTEHVAHLRAGYETADTGLSDSELRARARHQPAQVFGTPAPDSPLVYFTRLDLPSPMRASRIELLAPGTGGWTVIHRLTLIGADGRSYPMAAPEVWLRDRERWREVRRFSTSRRTDRGVDQSEPREDVVTVFENKRARPRSWMVSEIVALGNTDAIEAVRRSQLPNGRRFDSARMALVEPGELISTTVFAAGPASADVEEITDGRILVRASTTQGGFLVLSEAFYPGWRARIDGQVTPVRRTNVALQGVVVPPGHHLVEFEFVPWSLRIGTATSIVGVIGGLLLLVMDARQRRRGRPDVIVSGPR